jgi:hypothetical protein
MDHTRRSDRPENNESYSYLTLDKRIELILFGVRIRCHFKHKTIGVLRGVGLLNTKYIQGMRRAGYSPEVIFSIQESGDYRRGFADGWKTRTGTFALSC